MYGWDLEFSLGLGCALVGGTAIACFVLKVIDWIRQSIDDRMNQLSPRWRGVGSSLDDCPTGDPLDPYGTDRR